MAARLFSNSVEIGRLYELLCMSVLRSHSFQIVHTGRTGDKGVDFIGRWILPSIELPVVGQCKNWKTPLSPVHVREFEGTVASMCNTFDGPKRSTVAGILLSSNGFSEGAVNTLKASSFPLICCQLISHGSHMTDHKEQDQDWTSSRCNDLDISNARRASDVDGESSDVDRVSSDVDRVSSDVDRVSSDVDRVSSDVDQVSSDVDRVSSDVDCVHVLDSGNGQEGSWRRKEPELLMGTEMSALGCWRGGKPDKEMSALGCWRGGKRDTDMKGSILSFVLNNQVQKILPGISIAVNSGSIATTGGTCPPVSILYRTSVDRMVLHNVGMVTRRLPPSGKPIKWAKWTNPEE